MEIDFKKLRMQNFPENGRKKALAIPNPEIQPIYRSHLRISKTQVEIGRFLEPKATGVV